MADALISIVLEQFTSNAQQEVELVVGVREQVRKLNVTLRMIKGVLEDAEQQQEKNSDVKVWLEELKNVLYDADDVMDEWNTKMIVSQIQRVDLDDNAPQRKKVLSILLSPFYCFKHVNVRYDIGHKIKKIREELDEISTRKNQFGLAISSSHIQARRVTSSIVDVSKVCGRDADKEKIVSRLLGESSRQETGVQVVSIVAMGGFGKTTLAKLVLKDERVVRSFEKMMWVCVSEPFDLVGVAKAIIEEVGGEVPSSTEWEAMHRGLGKSVSGKRFILVLDDVWTKDSNHWNQLKLSLDGGALGSRVIVTTRNMEVAHMMGSSHIHSLEKLSENDSWSLLGDIALMGREEEREKFENTGKEIANKCKGVPLALSTLASLLCEKRTVENWRDILASDIWELAHMKDFFLPSLFLSYYSLPSTSKQCFLYCAVFPKDTKMEKEFLVKLWMAEGFLGSGRTEELERVGEDHFHTLAVRSFFQDFEKKTNGNIRSCKMHDLVHDFAQYLSGGECWNNAEFNCDKVRYLYSEEMENPSLYKAKKLRTLLNHKGGISIKLFSKLPCLRVLDLHYSELEKLPDAVEKLVHLRYLDLSDNGRLEELPETICNLYNLQTLRLNGCQNLKKLPEEIGRLSNLRHLEMESTDALDCLPQSLKRLSSLRTLGKFIVSHGWKIGDLRHFKNIGGSLELEGLGGITEESDAVEADLKKKKDLRCLSLDWGYGEEENDVAAGAVGMLERLEPHEDLEELRIRLYPGSQFPRWLLLGIIVKLEFCECPQITQLPALGKLSSLESLKIQWMKSVKSIGREFYYGLDSSLGDEMIAFPKLKRLQLWNMKGLENWELPIISKDTKIMPLLSKLDIESCPELKALPACLGKLESLEELDIEGLDSIERLDLNLVMPQEDQVLFPKLGMLYINGMEKLEQWDIMMPCLSFLHIQKCPRLRVLPDLTKFKSLVKLELRELDSWEGETEKEEEENVRNDEKRVGSMPYSFTQLHIDGCPKLIQVPNHFVRLKQLSIFSCPKLSGSQYLPPLLESLTLYDDCGGYSKSIPLQNNEECFITRFTLSSHISLPDGFKNLKALRNLDFYYCKSLDFELKELQHFTMLQQLEIYECPLLEERFQGDDWRSILPHLPKIIINDKEIH